MAASLVPAVYDLWGESTFESKLLSLAVRESPSTSLPHCWAFFAGVSQAFETMYAQEEEEEDQEEREPVLEFRLYACHVVATV